MDRNSNTYTIVYSAILVIAVATGLAILSISLKEPQEENRKIEKMQNILASFGKGVVPEGANKNSFIEKEYADYVIDSYAVGVDGEKKDEQDAFTIEMKVQLSLPSEKRTLPIFVAQYSGKKNYIVPVHGTGLWGAIWGYVSIAEDGSTIVGAVFDHAGETPGLGAEISTAHFYDQFIGKQIYEGDKFVSVAVLKPGSDLTVHSVDGISGGTITSHAVSDMLLNSLGEYETFLSKLKKESERIIPIEVEGLDERTINVEEAKQE